MSVLNILQCPTSESDHQSKEMASSGLAMVCRMTLRFAKLYLETKEPTVLVPICSLYNLRAARKRMQEQNAIGGDDISSHDIDILLAAEEKYYKAWVF